MKIIETKAKTKQTNLQKQITNKGDAKIETNKRAKIETNKREKIKFIETKKRAMNK